MNTMAAAIIRLEAIDSSKQRYIPRHGNAAREWWCRFLLDTHPDRHEQLTPLLAPPAGNHLPSPYTISFIHTESSGVSYLRVTALVEPLVEALINSLNHLPEELALDGCVYRVVGATLDPAQHPGAGTGSYTGIINETADQGGRAFYFDLMTPMCFHSKGQDIPFPEPRLFFGSLLNRWETFTGERILISLDSFIRDRMEISRFRLRGISYEYMPGRQVIGSVGWVRFFLRGSLKSADDHHAAHMIRVLATFAHYSGVGVRTTAGMGQIYLRD